MTARHLAAGLAGGVVFVLLAACTPGDAAGGETTSASHTTPPANSSTRATPSSPSELPALPGDRVDAVLPVTWSQSVLVDTGWTVQPRVRGSYFVGFSAGAAGAEPDDEDARDLTYSVIDSTGTVRWSVTRPATCTGFAVSTADGRPVVVLTDAEVTGTDRDGRSDGGRWQTTATAYDLATGEVLWGPVPVPGTVQGPGLVFGASAPAATMGEIGPRVALDPVTGRVVADESEPAGSGGTADLRVIGEYDGTVVVAQGSTVRAVQAAGGEQLWQTDTTIEHPAATPDLAAPPGTVVISAEGASGSAVIDLETGEELATDVDDVAYESLSRTWIFATGAAVSARGAAHDPWERTVPDGARIEAAGSGLVYLREGDDTVEVLNAVTGRTAQAYEADPQMRGYAVPRSISADGAALFAIGGRFLLATVPGPG